MHEKQSDYLKALGHPNRLQIVKLLLNYGSISVSDIQEKLGVNQANASQHLNKMKHCKVVQSQRKGTHIYYSLQNQKVAKDIINALDHLL